MTMKQYQKVKDFALTEKVLDRDERNARKYAEVKAYMYLTRDREHLSIEDAQNFFWAQKKFNYFKFNKGFGKIYSNRADEIIRTLATR